MTAIRNFIGIHSYPSRRLVISIHHGYYFGGLSQERLPRSVPGAIQAL